MNPHKLSQLLIVDLSNINNSINKPKSKLSRAKVKTKENYKKTYDFDLDLDITLSGKYLEAYNNTMNLRIVDLYMYQRYESNYYEYQCKLQQYLSKCGLNRTQQYYGTCWMNTIINSFVFCEQLRGTFLQILSIYIKNNKDFYTMIEKINKNAFKLIEKADANEKNIFNHFVCVLYNVLCGTGLRNTEGYNMALTNTALHTIQTDKLKIIDNNDVKEIIKNTGAQPPDAFDAIIQIFNNNMDNKPHLTNINTKYETSIYAINNIMHINKISIILNNDILQIRSDIYNNKNIQNIKIVSPEFSKYNINTSNSYIIDTLDTIKFLFLRTTQEQIPNIISCSVNNKITEFKLCSAIIGHNNYFNNKLGGHVITGFICNDEYYIYNSNNNSYYNIDWRNISMKNLMPYINAQKHYIYSNFMFDIAIYYNTSCDYSYKLENCKPSRP